MPLWRQCLGNSAKGFSDREVAVDLGPDYDMTEENTVKGLVDKNDGISTVEAPEGLVNEDPEHEEQE
ncbi:hypothetical protein FPQ18DRAFT_384811 [Pyronema domesticum]|nr:hypothetical protein FPQ18DRAFT_384811 [Pyronema domesticum]